MRLCFLPQIPSWWQWIERDTCSDIPTTVFHSVLDPKQMVVPDRRNEQFKLIFSMIQGKRAFPPCFSFCARPVGLILKYLLCEPHGCYLFAPCSSLTLSYSRHRLFSLNNYNWARSFFLAPRARISLFQDMLTQSQPHPTLLWLQTSH